jgi:hypothetical protein
MLTYKDCVGLSDLEEQEIEAIAQHEHIPEIVAAELGCCLAHQEGGLMRVDGMIRDDMAMAHEHHHPRAEKHWQEVLEHFEAEHPELAAAA